MNSTPVGKSKVLMPTELRGTTAAPDQVDLTDDEAGAAARAVIALFERWGLGNAEACRLLGGLGPRTWSRWKRGAIGRLDRQPAIPVWANHRSLSRAHRPAFS